MTQKKYVDNLVANKQIVLIKKLLDQRHSDESIASQLVEKEYQNLTREDGMWSAEDVEKIRIDFSLDIDNRDEIEKIVLTTESHADLKVLDIVEVISAEVAYGMNIFKDLFTEVRDIVGGRSETTQNTLRDCRREVLFELKQEAYLLGANAVIGVSLNYSEFSGGGKSMLFVVATGTAVKIAQ